MLRVSQDRSESIKMVPFLLDEQSRNEHCSMGMDFYLERICYVLNIELSNVEASQLNAVYDFFSKHCSELLTPDVSLSDFARSYKKRDGSLKRFLVFMLKSSDFNVDRCSIYK